MLVEREDLLRRLESVRPGLTPRELIEQSSCYVFQDGLVMTFNEEVACTIELDLGFDGAVKADKFRTLLQKLGDKELEVTKEEGKVFLKGKGKKHWFATDDKVRLAISSVDIPKKWKKLPADFLEGVGMAVKCCSTNKDLFKLTCVHFTKKFMESTDQGMQALRFYLKLDIQQDFLVRAASLRHIISLGMDEFSETGDWVHFSNPMGLIMSCKRWMDDYPKIDVAFDAPNARKIRLPKNLYKSVENVQMFAEETESKKILVDLSAKEVQVIGEGITGGGKERKAINYNGPAQRFWVDPAVFGNLAKEFADCLITDTKLKVEGPKFDYVAGLVPDKKREETNGKAEKGQPVGRGGEEPTRPRQGQVPGKAPVGKAAVGDKDNRR